MNDDKPAHETDRIVEVTPEMIKAGYKALRENVDVIWDYGLVEEIYRAMASVSAQVHPF